MRRLQIEQVKSWIRALGNLPADAELVVAELPCRTGDAAVVQVVMAAMLQNGGIVQHRLSRRLEELTQQEVQAAWSSDGEGWISLATE